MGKEYEQRDIEELWGKSGGLCAFPKCKKKLFRDPKNGAIGQIAHIVAQNANGPRADINYPKDKVDSYENLILLCPNHHNEIDPKTLEGKMNLDWPVEKLRTLKTEHENWVALMLSKGKPWQCNVSQLEYINFPRFALLASMEGVDFDVQKYDGKISLHNGGFETTRAMVATKTILDKINPRIINLEKRSKVTKNMIGAICAFDETFRTKNSSSVRDMIDNEIGIKGDLDYDPFIYKKYQFFKLVLPINPKWITSSTAISDFCSGGRRFSGICHIKDIDLNKGFVLASPYIIGIPKPKWVIPGLE